MKPIPNFEKYYKATKTGRIYSIRSSKFLSLNQKKNGYVYIELNVDGSATNHRVHRLIAKTFIPNPNNFEIVHHKNGIKNDNRADNLEWTTISQNTKHAYESGSLKRRFNYYNIYKNNILVHENVKGNKNAIELLPFSSQSTLLIYVDGNKTHKSGYRIELVERSTTIPKGSTL